jgi:CelD/BcsL family acetyltransferase involved in cellulose biosynthesis
MPSDVPELLDAAPRLLAVEDNAWVELVARHPDALPFHHPSWSQVLCESYGYTAFVLAVGAGDERIDGGMPVVEIRDRLGGRRWVSLPFTDRCRPLVTETATEALLVEVVDRARRLAQVARLDVHGDLPGDLHRRVRGVSHVLPLSPDPDVTLERSARSGVQRNVRKAERSELSLRRAEVADDVTVVYYGLHVRTRRRLGVPVQPRRFFEVLWRRVISRGLGFVLLAYHRDVPVAGAVFLTASRTVVYKFGASEPSSWPLRPNNLIFWEAIRWSCLNGFSAFDFGRSDIEHYGLRRFKNGWGAVEQPLVYATVGAKPPPLGPRGAALLSPLIRRGPLWLCRAIGELAYRRAA